jgi:hypothetical protein
MKDLNSTQLMIYEIEEAFNRDVLKMSPEAASETALIKVQSITRLVRLKRLS